MLQGAEGWKVDGRPELASALGDWLPESLVFSPIVLGALRLP